ncbi:MAG: S41 family peptidase [Thermoleophilaceae bacterium]
MTRSRSLIVVLLVCAPIAVCAVFASGLWLGGHPDKLPGPLRDAFVEEDRSLRAEIEDSIEDNYFKKVDADKLTDDSLKGIVRSLDDRFSTYITPKEAKEFQESITGKFDGVGMTIEEDKRGLRVLQVFDKTPAKRAGIHKGDLIVAVNGRSIAGVDSQVATARIKGEPGTSVKLSVVSPPGKKKRTFDVERARIEVPVAEGRIVERGGEKIAVVKLLSFSAGAHGLLRQEIDQLLKQGAQGIVLDLRGNGGGLLREGVLVASLFVEDGKIVSTKGRTKPERVFEAEGKAIPEDIPMVVLVDRGSASASEIVTGALRDSGRATVVGTRTFGKGVFQEVEPLSNGGVLELTVGQYFLPKGDNISDKGIQPAVKARDKPKTPRDEALPTAIDKLLEKAR